MSSFKAIYNGLDWTYLADIIISIIPALICITMHELAHGYVAYRLGDNTAKNAGRLTLNPLRHIDIMGLAMMVIFRFGWAKPVPVNMRNFENPKRGMALTALAGPAMNVLIAVVALFVYGLVYRLLYRSDIGGYVLDMLYMTAYLSIAFAIFNIIPIPPLDGSKVLFSVISDSAYVKLMRYERYGMICLILLIFFMNRSGVNPIGSITSSAVDSLFAIAEWSFELAGKVS